MFVYCFIHQTQSDWQKNLENFNVVGTSIEKLFDMWRNDEILKYYVICAAVSALSWLSQFCTSKKKDWNRFRENSKIRNFVAYQITFLLTCQPHYFSTCMKIHCFKVTTVKNRLFGRLWKKKETALQCQRICQKNGVKKHKLWIIMSDKLDGRKWEATCKNDF